MWPAVPTVSGTQAPGRRGLSPGKARLRPRLTPLAAACCARGRSPYLSRTVSRPLACLLCQRRPRCLSERADCLGHLVDLVVGERATVEQQLAVADDPDHRRLTCAQRGGQLFLECARVAL